MNGTKPRVLIVYGVILIGIIVVVLSFYSRTEESRQQSIAIGIGTWAGFGAGIVGMDMGFFGDMQVETKILDDNAARHAAFQSGALDVMISSIDVFAQEATQGVRGQVCLVTDESWGGDGIVATLEVKRLEDLRGKKVAYARGTPSHYLIHKVLESAGVSLQDVEHVQVDDPSRAGDVFLSGSVAAAVTWEPFLSQVAESGRGHILATTREFPDVTIDLLVASEELSADGEKLRRFMDGWLASVDYIKANPDEAAGIIAQGLNLPVEDVQGMMLGLKFADATRNKYFFDSEEVQNTRLVRLINEAGAYWKSVNIVSEPVEASLRVSAVSCDYFTAL